ncbi:MAG: sodium:solute symporter family protein [Peptococcaceae bacterium]|nr:sodium:solute symporter family protein [Peptococcaceae bacterium]
MGINWPILIGTVLMEIIIIFGVTAVLQAKERHAGSDSFIKSNRNLPMVAVAATQALTCLGGGHILGMTAASWDFGVAACWYAISSACMLIILFCFTGPWVRRLGFTTIGQAFERIFDRRTAVLVGCVGAGTIWGIMTLELQGVGSVISAITSGSMIFGCIIGGIISILYVIFGGMKQVGWVNIINAVFMYLGVIIALAMLGSKLPNGWAGVNEFFQSYSNNFAQGNEFLSIMSSPEIWKVYIIGTFLAGLFYVPIGPQAAQVSASAKSVNSLKKAVFIAVPMNAIFGMIMVAFGMAALSIPEYAGIGAPPFIAMFVMLIDLLPWWLTAWLFAAFAAAMLSTIAVQLLALSTIVVDDIYIRYYNHNMPEKSKMKLLRWLIVIIGAGGTITSTALPPVQNAIVWLFAWLLPAFWIFVFAMFWKRSSFAGFWTIIITGVVNILWSYTSLPSMLGLDGNNNSIAMFVVAFVVCILFTLFDRNAKPALIKVYKQNKFDVIAPELAEHYRAIGYKG